MSTLSVRNTGAVRETPKHRGVAESATKTKKSLKETQHEEFKEGLKEAVLISRGEIEGTPLSELWDE